MFLFSSRHSFLQNPRKSKCRRAIDETHSATSAAFPQRIHRQQGDPVKRNSLLTLEDTVTSPIEHGDAGVILKPDGTFKVFSTGVDGALTPAQEAQARKLIALAVALRFPEVMAVLERMADDPNIVGEGIDLGAAN
jgi:hypothetical protein